MTSKEKLSFLIRCGLRFSSDESRIMDIIREEVNKTPTTKEPTTGEWKTSDNRWGLGSLRCSNCNIYYDTDPNYCPNCGAKMKGADND